MEVLRVARPLAASRRITPTCSPWGSKFARSKVGSRLSIAAHALGSNEGSESIFVLFCFVRELHAVTLTRGRPKDHFPRSIHKCRS